MQNLAKKFEKKREKSGGKFFLLVWFLIQKLNLKSGLHAKIREKSLVIKSEGFIGLLKGENFSKGGGSVIMTGGNAI